ncbi:MAG: hypothetical protein BWY47_00747 [Bacteroidetes bacterium ADurb.Bin302]|nr:MAG: hypothetical protein BWY47_00747 [Bacteroidetes bacterium ADurb.Bin302]
MLIIESSTTIPSTTISAASVTVLSSILNRYINPIETAVQMGKPELATRAVRSGNSINITTITTIIDMIRSRKNELTDLSTTVG